MTEIDRLFSIAEGTGMEQIFVFNIERGADWPGAGLGDRDMLLVRRSPKTENPGDLYVLRTGETGLVARLKETRTGLVFERAGAEPLAAADCVVWAHVLRHFRRGP